MNLPNATLIFRFRGNVEEWSRNNGATWHPVPHNIRTIRAWDSRFC